MKKIKSLLNFYIFLFLLSIPAYNFAQGGLDQKIVELSQSIAKEMTEQFMGYPVHSIISFIIVIALAIIIFTVFIDIRRLSGGMAGILAYHFGKASGEMSTENFKNYRTALDGILYVIVVSLAYLLFAGYLAEINPAIPAILLILIVVWAIFALWRSCRAIAAAIGRYTSKWADELEKQAKKA